MSIIKIVLLLKVKSTCRNPQVPRVPHLHEVLLNSDPSGWGVAFDLHQFSCCWIWYGQRGSRRLLTLNDEWQDVGQVAGSRKCGTDDTVIRFQVRFLTRRRKKNRQKWLSRGRKRKMQKWQSRRKSEAKVTNKCSFKNNVTMRVSLPSSATSSHLPHSIDTPEHSLQSRKWILNRYYWCPVRCVILLGDSKPNTAHCKFQF